MFPVREFQIGAVLLLNVYFLVFVRLNLMYNLSSECLVVDVALMKNSRQFMSMRPFKILKTNIMSPRIHV